MHRGPNPSLNLREQITATVRQRREALAADLAAVLAEDPSLDADRWHECAGVLVNLLGTAIQTADTESVSAAVQDLTQFSPPLTTRQIIRSLHRAERMLADELSSSENIGGSSDQWPAVAHSLRTAAVELSGSFAERHSAMGTLRDPLTTLISPLVFDYALSKEVLRALRHAHGISVLLFDIDNLDRLNHSHGYGAGDRLLERLGILARSYFRTHDWVSRYGGDSIAVMLPETTLDQAATLAFRFRNMVRQRLVLVDHKTEAITTVTVSCAAVGTDTVNAELSPVSITTEAEAAAMRAKMNGGNCVEIVALLPTALTITGAAFLLGMAPRAVARLVRQHHLEATRRGRHLYIVRDAIEEYRKRL
jgi:diguanylate cyclase (GGDEF)-like protein/excisionase family DNA binding protein